LASLARLKPLTAEELLAQRHAKYEKMGFWLES
jgi:acetyl-CoA carboxylase alpha subunit